MSPLPLPSPKRILIVEGQNDKHVVLQFRSRNPAVPDFDIMDKGGIDPLLESISREVKAPERQVIGILVDADDGSGARWDSIVNRISQTGIEFPDHPNPDGTIVDTQDMPRVGVWLMPDNESSGELENFIEQMIPKEDAVWPLSRNYIEGIPVTYRKFTEGNELKATIYAWLATREDPRQMGLAIKTRDLEIDGDLCKRFAGWLTNLFGNDME